MSKSLCVLTQYCVLYHNKTKIKNCIIIVTNIMNYHWLEKSFNIVFELLFTKRNVDS